jgi:FtsP/CotA-like multicopper oxidase with cupredoxin domain
MMGQSNSTGLVDPAAAAAAERNLPIVPLDDGVADGSGGRQFALTVQRGSSQILSGVSTPTLGYNGAMLGPALRLRTGERTTIRVRNDLDEVTTAHWHGLVVPPGVDGGPHQPIAPGATFGTRVSPWRTRRPPAGSIPMPTGAPADKWCPAWPAC